MGDDAGEEGGSEGKPHEAREDPFEGPTGEGAGEEAREVRKEERAARLARAENVRGPREREHEEGGEEDAGHAVAAPPGAKREEPRDAEEDGERRVELELEAQGPEDGTELLVAENALQVDEVGEHLRDRARDRLPAPEVPKCEAEDGQRDGEPVRRVEADRAAEEEAPDRARRHRDVAERIGDDEAAHDEEDFDPVLGLLRDGGHEPAGRVRAGEGEEEEGVVEDDGEGGQGAEAVGEGEARGGGSGRADRDGSGSGPGRVQGGS